MGEYVSTTQARLPEGAKAHVHLGHPDVDRIPPVSFPIRTGESWGMQGSSAARNFALHGVRLELPKDAPPDRRRVAVSERWYLVAGETWRTWTDIAKECEERRASRERGRELMRCLNDEILPRAQAVDPGGECLHALGEAKQKFEELVQEVEEGFRALHKQEEEAVAKVKGELDVAHDNLWGAYQEVVTGMDPLWMLSRYGRHRGGPGGAAAKVVRLHHTLPLLYFVQRCGMAGMGDDRKDEPVDVKQRMGFRCLHMKGMMEGDWGVCPVIAWPPRPGETEEARREREMQMLEDHAADQVDLKLAAKMKCPLLQHPVLNKYKEALREVWDQEDQEGAPRWGVGLLHLYGDEEGVTHEWTVDKAEEEAGKAFDGFPQRKRGEKQDAFWEALQKAWGGMGGWQKNGEVPEEKNGEVPEDGTSQERTEVQDGQQPGGATQTLSLALQESQEGQPGDGGESGDEGGGPPSSKSKSKSASPGSAKTPQVGGWVQELHCCRLNMLNLTHLAVAGQGSG